jgi:hypothetical protein
MNGMNLKLKSDIANKIHCLLISEMNHQKARKKYHWQIFVHSFVTKEEANKHEKSNGFQNGHKTADDTASLGITSAFVSGPNLPQ